MCSIPIKNPRPGKLRGRGLSRGSTPVDAAFKLRHPLNMRFNRRYCLRLLAHAVRYAFAEKLRGGFQCSLPAKAFSLLTFALFQPLSHLLVLIIVYTLYHSITAII